MCFCVYFEGALMFAIRSLEQHVDCLLSYDFSDLDDDAFEVPIDVPAEDDSAE